MNTISRVLFALAALALSTAGAEARLRHAHHTHVHYRASATPAMVAIGPMACDNNGRCLASPAASSRAPRAAAIDANGTRARRTSKFDDFTYIPNPAGCGRISVSCACRLAAHWGLGKGLDKVSVWPKRFARASGPGIGIAAVRRDQHHIIGIIGGGPGAWRVVDFNSGGHRNREYTVSDFGGYFFVDPRSRLASR